MILNNEFQQMWNVHFRVLAQCLPGLGKNTENLSSLPVFVSRIEPGGLRIQIRVDNHYS